MNALTAAGVLAEDRLFATLDPTARSLRLPDGREVLLVDTVGLVRRLPHQLVEAFRSTLEEAVQADAVLNVCDAASPEAEEQLQLTEDLLRDLRIEGTAQEAGQPAPPVLRVYNKCDLLGGPLDLGGRRAVAISARTGAGLSALLEALASLLPPDRRRVRVLLPFRRRSPGGTLPPNGRSGAGRVHPRRDTHDRYPGPAGAGGRPSLYARHLPGKQGIERSRRHEHQPLPFQ